MNCDELERNLDCFKTGKDVFGNTVTFNFPESTSGPEYGQGKGFEITSENDDSYQVIFCCFDNGTLNLGNLTLINEHDQMEVAKFLRQEPDEWFKGNEYNIIIARDYGQKCFYTAYMHWGNKYYTNDEVKLDELSGEDYVFTQEQIDDLKSHLPDNMKKIVDLAKVEVKDE